MKKTTLILLLVCISSIAFSQDQQKSDSTSTNLVISDRPFQVVDLSTPLYILDNKEIAFQDVGKIEADKISSITVLKDSMATARYGERGRMGVIIIELKDARQLPIRKKRSTIE
jgi:TonB-dependent SusC/RagA subfamily outer membrane receptor